MKKTLFLAACSALLLSFASCQSSTGEGQPQGTVLTFEDGSGVTRWSNYIDTPQYGGDMLYGGNGYSWQDSQTTLRSVLPDYWADKTFFGGGIVISNYVDKSGDINYEKQLAISVDPKSGKNFAICYVATNLCPPSLEFAEGVGIIKSLFVAPTAYADAVVQSGNAFSLAMPANGYIRLQAKGYNAAGAVTGICDHYLYDGRTFGGWRVWDLSALGAVKRVEFTMYEGTTEGSLRVDSTAEYPTYPSYFAIDDISIVKQ